MFGQWGRKARDLEQTIADCLDAKKSLVEENAKVWRLKETQEKEMIELREQISRLSTLKQAAEVQASELDERLKEEQKQRGGLSRLVDQQAALFGNLDTELERTRGQLVQANNLIAHLQGENARLVVEMRDMVEKLERLQLGPLFDGLPTRAKTPQAGPVVLEGGEAYQTALERYEDQLSYLAQRIRLAYSPLYQAIQEMKRWRLSTTLETKSESKDQTPKSQ